MRVSRAIPPPARPRPDFLLQTTSSSATFEETRARARVCIDASPRYLRLTHPSAFARDAGFNKKKPKKGTKMASEKPKVAKGKGKLPKKKRARRSDDDDDDDDGKDSGSGSDE